MKTLRFTASNIVPMCLVAVTAVAVVGTIQRDGSKAPTALSGVHTTAPAGNLANLPAGLVSAVAQTLAARSPAIWQASHRAGHTAKFNNPIQHFTASFSSDGARLQLGKKENTGITMRLIAYRNGNVIQPVTTGTISVNGNRVDLSHGHGLTEWYENSPLGMEQGFAVATPLKSTALGHNIALIFNLGGDLRPVQVGDSIEFRNAVGGSILHYGGLLAWDAHHRILPAKLQLQNHELLLSVNTAGASYPVTIDPLFSVITTFSDSRNNTAADLFGGSVALSADGNTALIGADGTTVSGNDAVGVAYVFNRTNGTWSTTPTQSFADPVGASNDLFGESIALSSDGSTALISAPGTNSFAGAAYVFTRTNGVWSSTPTQSFADPVGATSDQFGVRVVLAGDGSSALIGANGTTVSGKSFVGAAYVYTQSNGTWPSAPTHSFADPAGAAEAFGASVALSGDGSTALIGADGAAVSGNNGAGVAYVFVRTSGVWSSVPAHTFSDPRATSGDSFGSSVALSSDGTVVLVGATFDISGNSNVGAAYVYAQNNGIWLNTPSQSFTDPLNGANDFFGWRVALSSDGTAVLIGAYGGLGAAYAYVQSNGIWPNTPTHVFADPVSGGGNGFGIGVALTGDGSGALIGAWNTRISGTGGGTAYFFTPSADLSLALSSSPGSVTVGQNVTYLLTVTNNDTQVTATNLMLADTLPSDVTFISVNAAGGTCNNNGGTVTCTLASLAPQATWQPSIIVTAESAGTVKDSASVNANQPDPNTENNSATVTTTANAATPPPSRGGSSGGGGGALGFLSLLFLASFLRCRKGLG